MRGNIWVFIAIMAGVTYLVRILPLLLIKREIKNKTARSFLYYVPYVTLAVMSFPAITEATQSPWAGAAALVAGILCAWADMGLLKVSVISCLVVLITELFI